MICQHLKISSKKCNVTFKWNVIKIKQQKEGWECGWLIARIIFELTNNQMKYDKLTYKIDYPSIKYYIEKVWEHFYNVAMFH